MDMGATVIVVQLTRQSPNVATNNAGAGAHRVRSHPMPGKPTIPRVCERCSAPFMTRAYEIPRGRGKFCSVSCGVISSHTRPLAERFWEKVNKDGPIPEYRLDLGPCWIWTGSRTGAFKEYGEIQEGTGRKVRVHRLSYEMHGGVIPPEYVVDHLCRMPLCVNPSHLEAVTHRENTLRGVAPAAECARRETCAAGHPWNVENTRWRNDKRGHSRICRACERIRDAGRGRRARRGRV